VGGTEERSASALASSPTLGRKEHEPENPTAVTDDVDVDRDPCARDVSGQEGDLRARERGTQRGSDHGVQACRVLEPPGGPQDDLLLGADVQMVHQFGEHCGLQTASRGRELAAATGCDGDWPDLDAVRVARTVYMPSDEYSASLTLRLTLISLFIHWPGFLHKSCR